MFVKLCMLALLLRLVASIQIQSADPLYSGGLCTVTWSAETTDALTFSMAFFDSTGNSYSVANNVRTALGKLSFTLPIFQPGLYTLKFFATDNIDDTYAERSGFTILPATSSSGTASSTSLNTASTATSSASLSTPLTTLPSSTATLSTPGTSSAASSTPSAFKSSGATSFKWAGIVPTVALVLSVAAGAAMVF